MSAAGEEVRAEGLVIGAGEVGGKDAAGCGHARIGGKWRVRVRVRVATRLRATRLRRDGSSYGQEKLRVEGTGGVFVAASL